MVRANAALTVAQSSGCTTLKNSSAVPVKVAELMPKLTDVIVE
jgi:hypothetical protein